MRTIYKYQLPSSARFDIEMPIEAEILHIGEQQNVGCIWVATDDEIDTKEIRSFRIAGTGNERPNPVHYTYLGTYILDSGTFVWHLYEEVKK